MPSEQDILDQINANPNQNYHTNNDPDNNEENNSKNSEVLAFIWETAKIIIISLAIIIPIRYYLVQPFFVKGASMEENFHDGDYLLIDEISYRLEKPSRGDVVVFRYPENPSQFFIKRIIGLPGETVEIRNNIVRVYNSDFPKGLVVEEDYLASSQETLGNFQTKLGENEYYVLGDNRTHSSDSRSWGPVDKSLITGRAFLRLWPFNNITKIKSVTY
ncbi:MAG: signal peptidase I [Candidatus Yanofskybacteria bacterium]|nr:signal peptidase I [Candidatus Yanofskybacteria bacterium]